ncbi:MULTISPECIES: DUF2877 domain-containing protein [Vagococcus]|uniref:DUF2877 domain-containing protein n=1 Tax=Vagococcus fluvialis bH819 TaxID=1255619 RepID=A0A1X6WQQ5_9ENTE|nr:MULTISPECIES: DUF2877 domain-containing protein [Vagococcus]SLM86588.1 hypothetical protein FM121_10875 [Vagococcus fluvialis bH819]HCM90796.1 DUF2877 domain-containing protein [Vagococcus sp.]
MIKIQGLTYSDDLADKKIFGKIHSVFERTFNVETETQRIITIATPTIFDGPQMIKIDTFNIANLGLEVGMIVSQLEKKILVDDRIEINVSQASPIEAIPLLFPETKHEEIKRHVEIINYLLETNLDTVGFYRKNYPNEVEKVMHHFLMDGRENLKKGWQQEDLTMLGVAISSLIGLGHGLTPSGDDFITGFLLVINSHHYPNVYLTSEVNKLVDRGKGRTNLISQNQLLLAIKGKSLTPISRFLSDLYSGASISTLTKSVEEILSVGSSSGSDILAGILSGVELSLEQLEKINKGAFSHEEF